MKTNIQLAIFNALRNRLKSATPENGYTYPFGQRVFDSPQNLTEDVMPCAVIIMGESRSVDKINNGVKGLFVVDVMVNAHCRKPNTTNNPTVSDTEAALALLFEVQTAMLGDGVILLKDMGISHCKVSDVVSSITQAKQDGLPIVDVGVLLRVEYQQPF